MVDLEGEGDGGGALVDLPVVIIAVMPGTETPAAGTAPGADLVDVVVGDAAAAARVVAAVDAHPLAATALALLLRGAERRTVPEGLVAESATYSLLQFGPEHVAWLDRRGPPRVRARDERPLRVRREGERVPSCTSRSTVRRCATPTTPPCATR